MTTRIRLGKKAVDGLAPGEKAYDSEIRGFGVRATASGDKFYFLEYRPGAGGRTVNLRRLSLGRHGDITADGARKAALDARAAIRLGDDPMAEKARQRASLSVGGLVEAFDNNHLAKLKPSSQVNYRIVLKKLTTAFGSIKAESLTRSQVASLHRDMSDAPFQANRTLSAVSKMYSWAESVGQLPEGHPNPARKISRYREQGRERYLTGDELARLGDALREGETIGLPYGVDETKAKAKHAPKAENRLVKLDPFAVAAIRLLALTGARLHEVLDAQWSQIDLERDVLFLSDSKTGRKPIYLSAAAQAVIAALPRVAGNPHLIPGAKDGEPRKDLKKPWVAVVRAAGLDGLRIHDLRHSFASFGAGASLGLPVIGKLLGHSQPATTARYAHLDADPMRKAVETIGATIGGAMNRSAGAQILRIKK